MFVHASARVRISGRFQFPVERLAEIGDTLREREGVGDVGVQRRAALTTISSGDFSFACQAPSDRNSGDAEHGLEHRAQIAVGFREGVSHAGDQNLWSNT